MKRILQFTLSILFVGCTSQSDIEQSRHLRRLMDDYVEEYHQLNPLMATYIGENRFNDRLSNDVSETHRQKARDMYTRYLEGLSKIDPDDLHEQDQLNFDVFGEILHGELNGLRFNDHLFPVNQMFCLPLLFPMLGSGRSVQPFQTVEDYRNFLSRMQDYVVWVDTAIAKMKYGTGIGMVQPGFIMEKALPPLEAQIVEDLQDSQFFMPITNMPGGFTPEETKELTGAYEKAITELIIPSYRKLHTYIRDEYIPECRSTIGFSDLPAGEPWYRYLVKHYTTTEMTPDEIHELGKKEVERIRGEMREVQEAVGVDGSLMDFFEYIRTDRQFYYTDGDSLLNG
ncbi:MAG: DUF885 domain-containing protein, partial [Bacteroidetes bacterium]|nr:DUF885 domain-containing protein [Bacteroidota bacterium]